MRVPTASFPRSKTLYVDATYGNDDTARRAAPHLPYALPSAARAAAIRGDTIVVAPGVYADKNLLKSWSVSNGGTSGDVARASNVVTVKTSSAHGFSVGDLVRVSGVGTVSFDGEFVVASVADSTHYTYAQVGSDASSSGGVSQGLLSYHFEPGVVINQTSGSGGVFDDTSNGANGSCWCRVTGGAFIVASNSDTGIATSSQASIKIGQTDTKLDIDAHSIQTAGDPCVHVSGTRVEFNGRFKKLACTDSAAVSLGTGRRLYLRADDIVAVDRTVWLSSGSTSTVILETGSIRCTDANGFALLPTGSGFYYVSCKRMVGSVDLTLAGGRYDLGRVEGHLELSSITTSVLPNTFVNTEFNAAGQGASQIAVDFAGFASDGIYLQNCTLRSGASASYSVTSGESANLVIIGTLYANKPLHSNISVSEQVVIVGALPSSDPSFHGQLYTATGAVKQSA